MPTVAHAHMHTEQCPTPCAPVSQRGVWLGLLIAVLVNGLCWWGVLALLH
jgi:hypothetical protein